MKNFKSVILQFCIFAVLFFIASCGNSKDEKNKDENVKQKLPSEPTEVKIMTLTTTDFTQELVSSGKITSRQVAELRFQTSEIIDKIFVKNGDQVSKNQIIARLELFKFNNKLKQAKNNLEQSQLKLQELIIGQGYKLNDTAAIPDKMLELMKVKSGFNNAKNQYDLANFDLSRAILRAPFSGKIANIESKEHTLANTSKPFCNIINLKSMEVVFSVLENELNMINKGDVIQVSPYSTPNLVIKGNIIEINPWVDENGMVKVKAKLNYNKQMVEGMNVKVSIFHSLGKQWVVPKTAVVLRTAKEVVFVLKDNIAMWNYVKIGKENATHYTITSETLKDGDKIITEGNINLAHESPVKVID